MKVIGGINALSTSSVFPNKDEIAVALDFYFKTMYNSNVYILFIHHQRKDHGPNTGLFNGRRKKQS